MTLRALLAVLEAALWAVGAASLALYFGAVAYGEVERQDAVVTFAAAYPAADQTTWSQQRIAAFEASAASGSSPVAVLRIVRVGLEVPVYNDSSERNLNRGAGLIEGTASVGSGGNLGIAAHRDGYFRALREVAIGDLIEVDGPQTRRVYEVSELAIVHPSDLSPLAESSSPVVTLVTCYPFYFAGSAPQRYIVRAVLLSETGATQ